MFIDDLLGGHDGDDDGGQPGPPQRPAQPMWRRTFSLLAFAGIWTLAAYVALSLAGRATPLWVLLAFALAMLLIRRMVRWLRPPPQSRHAGRTRSAASNTPDGLALAVTRWARLLDWSHTDTARFQRRVQPRLAELAGERLRQQHGVNLADNPERARQLLGEPLWKLVAHPVRRPPSPRELEAAVAALERA